MAAAATSADVLRWRAERLVEHGFDAALARTMAADGRFDLHAAIELVERGCPPQLAARIVAPLDVDGRAAAGRDDRD